MSLSRLSFFRQYINSSLWMAPLLAIPLALLTSWTLHWLDTGIEWDFLGITVSGATAMYQALISAALTFMVFTFGALLIAIQIASGQMTPRIIASAILRANVPKYTVALFIFTLIVSMSALNNMDKNVNQLVALCVAILGIGCFAAFFYLIDSASRTLRPVSILKRVADEGLAVIERVYPDPSLGPDAPVREPRLLGRADRVVVHRGTSAIVLSVDTVAVIAEAERTNSLIEFVPQVGDFVGTEDPLFDIHGEAPGIDEKVLTSAVEFGSERTLEQDPDLRVPDRRRHGPEGALAGDQ